jgi:hypothetical protein
MIHVIVGAGVGFVVGAFTPAVGRKIKAFFVKEAAAAKAKVASEESAVVKKVL